MGDEAAGRGEPHKRRRRRRATAAQGPPAPPTPAASTPAPPPPAATESRAAVKSDKQRRRDTGIERGLRDLVGAGRSQLGVSGALRGRDLNRPTEDDLAQAERDLTIVRRNWKPDEPR